MSRQALAGFVVINVIVSILVVVLVILLLPDDINNNDENASSDDSRRIIVFFDPITGERVNVPGQSSNAENVLVVTTTPLSSSNGEVPADLLYGTIGAQQRENRALRQTVTAVGLEADITQEPTGTLPVADTGSIPTLDPELLPPAEVILPGEGTIVVAPGTTAVPTVDDGCERYTVVAGDNCGVIAERFDVSLRELIELNGIDANCTTLRVNQEIRIPGEFCKPPPTATVTPTITSTPFDIDIPATFAITNTPRPTAEPAEARMQIIDISGYGDITSESIVLQNQGETLNLEGWTIEDEQGNTFTFPAFRIFNGGIIRIFTLTGDNTQAALYWNQSTAIWTEGETATLYDAEGEVQSTFVAGEE